MSHFWMAKKDSDEMVCEQCGKLSFNIMEDDKTECKPTTSKPVGLEDRKTFETQIEGATDDQIARLVFADWLDEQEDKDYAHAMRKVPNWVVAKEWKNPEHSGWGGVPHTTLETYPPWVDQVRGFVNTQPMRIRCVLWVNYLSYLFPTTPPENPPTTAEIYAAFPSSDPMKWLAAIESVLKDADPNV